MYYSSLDGNPDEPGDQRFGLDRCHDFYSKFHTQWDNSSARILEFGGGPVITHLISGVPYVNEVVFAAHTKEERQEVRKWREAEGDYHNWDHYFQYVVNGLEQNADKEFAWKEREDLLRNRMKKIIACDITKEQPLESGVYKEEFDIIMTSLCLEAACQSYAEYKSAVQKLSFMLKIGGFLVMIAVEEETFYYIGDRKWFCLPLSLSQIKEALHEAGLEVLDEHRDPASPEELQNPTDSDFKAMLFIVAKKI